jgi:hypothetical protein
MSKINAKIRNACSALLPTDGTLLTGRQNPQANNYGASQVPQEEYINEYPRLSHGDLNQDSLLENDRTLVR